MNKMRKPDVYPSRMDCAVLEEIPRSLDEVLEVTMGPSCVGSSMTLEIIDDGSPRDIILERKELLLIANGSQRDDLDIHRSMACH